MTYPNNRILDYVYNSGLDGTISRVSGLKDDNTGTHVEDYSYLGVGTMVQRAHPEPGVNQTYIQQSGDTYYNSDGGDQYTGLDRFNRVIDQFWTTTTDRFQYAYDRDNNALYKNNLQNSGLSELYHQSSTSSGDNASSYDKLSRLANFVRGALSTSGNNGSSGLGSLDTVSTPSTQPSHSQSWTLDALGNWSSQTVDGTATSRTHNSKNQVTAVGSASLTFDNNGNTTTDQRGYTYTYDAWNRLIAAKNGGTTLASYVYDAKGWRVKETHGSTTTDCYFDNSWRVIEERQSSTVTNQYIWSLAYIDGLILRDDNSTSGSLGISGSGLGRRFYAQQDANWNTTALINTSGSVQERFVYDAYGNGVCLNASGSPITDPFNWNYLYQGMRGDPVVSLYNSRNRDDDPLLGRWLQQDPASYIDGLNLYQAYESDPVELTDPSGLKAKIWTFSGINNWGTPKGAQAGTPPQFNDYVGDSFGGDLGWASHLGTTGEYNQTTSDWSGDTHLNPDYNGGQSVMNANSTGILNDEAKATAATRKPGEFCKGDGKKAVTRVLMISPKTGTPPPQKSCCCDIQTEVYWDPQDGVPNQGLNLMQNESNAFWGQFGHVNTVQTQPQNPNVAHARHALDGFLHNNMILEEEHGFTDLGEYVAGYNPTYNLAPDPRSHFDNWKNDPNVDRILVCHSQGCNIAMHMLGQVCQKAK